MLSLIRGVPLKSIFIVAEAGSDISEHAWVPESFWTPCRRRKSVLLPGTEPRYLGRRARSLDVIQIDNNII
jgi:hypothetical protein